MLPKICHLGSLLFTGIATVLVLSPTGCKVGPDPKPLQATDAGPAMPAIFAAPALTEQESEADATAASAKQVDATPELDQWWQRFSDPVLDALIAKVDQSNTSIATALSRVRIAQAKLGISEGDLWPSIAAGAQYQRVKQNFSRLAATGVEVNPYDTYSYGLGLASWEIDIWGRVQRLVESSSADLRGTVDDLRSALVSVRAQAATAYVGARTLQSRLDVLTNAITNLTQTLTLAKQKYDSGTVTKLDVNQAQSNLDLEAAAIPSLRTAYAQSLGQLATLCGSNTQEITKLIGPAKQIPIGPEAIAVGAPAALLARRPDLRAAAEQYQSMVAQIGAADALHYPALSLSGNFYISSTSFTDLSNWSNRAFSFGPTLSLPLFTGGKIDSQVLAAKASAEFAFNSWRGRLVQAVAEVDVAIATLALARDSDAQYKKAVASANDTYRLARLQYDAGTTQLENLIEIQNQVLKAEDAEVQSRGLVAQSVVELYRALGGGWERTLPNADNAKQESQNALTQSPADETSVSPVAKAKSEIKQ
ncbi:RND transporter [Planctomycetota bacterium]|nr:RND transporter [Planctomycetota bacterium]